MNTAFIKNQGARIAVNYARMLGTFVLGLLIIKHLLAVDNSLYSVFALVTVGLAFGVMVREVLRSSLVPFLTRGNKEISPQSFRKSLTVSFIAIVFFLLLMLIVLLYSDVFSVHERYRPTFDQFILLRTFGYVVLLTFVPVLNVFAANGQMVVYNIYLFLERLGDFFAVEVVVFNLFTDDLGSALLINGMFYLAWNVVLVSAFYWYFLRRNEGKSLLPCLLSKEDWRYMYKQIFGNTAFVLNMAFYFRFSLILINVYFGELLSSIYAVIVQLLGYLRQVIMGLVTGIDSFFSVRILGKEDIEDAELVNIFGQLNSLILVPLSILLFLMLPSILNDLESEDMAVFHVEIITLARIFLVGVVLRSMSEHWMHFLLGKGAVERYSYKLLMLSLTSPLLLSLMYYFNIADPVYYLGIHFIIAMTLGHMIIVPVVLSHILMRPYWKLISQPVLRSVLYTVLVGGFVLMVPSYNATLMLVAFLMLPIIMVDIGLFVKKIKSLGML